ncbi:MAG: hypothetical protein BIFFINMI_00260 [Phycisphaerae bacterium]|nr:hypothetical protein [Phycisphaerae bacterium]
MSDVLVIGYGNALRCDDGLGPEAAERLAASLGPGTARVQACHQLTPELAEPISRADFVLFLDAACDGEPGTLRVQAVLPADAPAGATIHAMEPSELLNWTRALFGRSPEAWLLTIAGADFGVGCQLSPPVRDALPSLLAEARALIRSATDRATRKTG